MDNQDAEDVQPILGVVPQWIGAYRSDILYTYKDAHGGLHKVRVLAICDNFVRIKFAHPGGHVCLVSPNQIT